MRAILRGASALSLILWGATASAAATGHITYATKTHGFLDVGGEEGVRVGDILTLQGTAASSLTCRVDAVSDHYGRCVGDGLPRRARFAILHASTSPPPVSRAKHYSALGAIRVQKIRTALSAAPYTLLPTQSLSRQLFGHGSALFAHDAYVWTGVQPRTLQSERFELAARAALLSRFPDLTATVRLTALYWAQRDALPLRFRAGVPGQIYVWQGDVSERGVHDNLVFAVGRTHLWYVPGVVALDGVQIGYRSDDARFEVGAYGGVLPNPTSLLLDSRHVTAGLYNRVQGNLGAHWTLSNTARLAFVSAQQIQQRLELESRTELTRALGLRAAVSPRVGFDLATHAVVLDALRAEMSGQPSDRWSLSVSGRYANGHLDRSHGFDLSPLFLRSTWFGEGVARYMAADWFSMGVLSVVGRDNGSGHTHVAAGPDVLLPRAFGRYGNLSASFLYEVNTYPATTQPEVVPGSPTWFANYAVFLQSALMPNDVVSLWLRVSYFTDTTLGTNRVQQLAYFARAQAAITGWLDAGAMVRVHQGLPNPQLAGAVPTHILGTVQLTGRL